MEHLAASAGSPGREPHITDCSIARVYFRMRFVDDIPYRRVGADLPPLLQQRMIFRQLLGIPDRQLVSHACLGHLIFGQRLNDLVVD